MTQTNLARPQGLSRIDPALRDTGGVAVESLGIEGPDDSVVPDWIVSQENRSLRAQSLRRVFAM